MQSREPPIYKYNEDLNKPIIFMFGNDVKYIAELSLYLSDFDYSVDADASLAYIYKDLSLSVPDIVLIDLPLISKDAGDIVRHYYSMAVSPCLLLLSSYSYDIDRIVMLELGADAVLSKSVSFREILAKIRAIERRYKAVHHERMVNRHNVSLSILGAVSYNGWSVSLDSLTLTSPRSNRVILSRSELQILMTLFRSPGTRFSRADLSLSIGRTDDESSRHIDSIVVRLRRKLAKEGGDTLIETAPGIGYFCKG